jgi:DNA excision repair protein ERCC-5
VFKSSDIAADLGLSRNDLIGMAYFLGSDYCDGINGIGIVNALEIVQCFPMKNNPIEGLTMFSEWLNNFNVDEILGAAKEDIKPLDKQV